MEISSAVRKLPLSGEFLPLYFEILSTTSRPLLWGCFADLLKEPCRDNPEFKEIILKLLEDPKTKGARGYLLNAVECFDTFDHRTMDILINEIAYDNFECRNKASAILSAIYTSANAEDKEYVRSEIEKARELVGERLDLLEVDI